MHAPVQQGTTISQPLHGLEQHPILPRSTFPPQTARSCWQRFHLQTTETFRSSMSTQMTRVKQMKHLPGAVSLKWDAHQCLRWRKNVSCAFTRSRSALQHSHTIFTIKATVCHFFSRVTNSVHGRLILYTEKPRVQSAYAVPFT